MNKCGGFILGLAIGTLLISTSSADVTTPGIPQVPLRSVSTTLSAAQVNALTASAGTTPTTLVAAVPGKSILPFQLHVIKSTGTAFTINTDADLAPCSTNTGLWFAMETTGLLDQATVTRAVRSVTWATLVLTDRGVAMKLCVDAGSLTAGSPIDVQFDYFLLP